MLTEGYCVTWIKEREMTFHYICVSVNTFLHCKIIYVLFFQSTIMTKWTSRWYHHTQRNNQEQLTYLRTKNTDMSHLFFSHWILKRYLASCPISLFLGTSSSSSFNRKTVLITGVSTSVHTDAAVWQKVERPLNPSVTAFLLLPGRAPSNHCDMSGQSMTIVSLCNLPESKLCARVLAQSHRPLHGVRMVHEADAKPLCLELHLNNPGPCECVSVYTVCVCVSHRCVLVSESFFKTACRLLYLHPSQSATLSTARQAMTTSSGVDASARASKTDVLPCYEKTCWLSSRLGRRHLQTSWWSWREPQEAEQKMLQEH